MDITDRLIYNGTGSYTGNIDISATDANAPATLGGPNVDNISVTMTYDDAVIAPTIVQEIEEIFELGGSLNNKKINAEIADAKLIIKESKSKVEWLKKGLSAAANCMIGKI